MTLLVAPLTFAVATSALAQPVGQDIATFPAARSQPIPGRYIVVFKPGTRGVAAEAAKIAGEHGGQVHHTYSHALQGFTATLPEAALQGIHNNPNVLSIEQDQTVSVQQVVTAQSQATWGLDRIDQADRPLDTLYHFGQTGAGVTAFVVDTGIRSDHLEFSGRLRPGFTAIADGRGTNDCHGHGTHVAGTLGGTTWGVAKDVAVTPVRVLDCSASGAWSGVIAGIDWVAASTARPAVANLSLGGAASTSVDAAVAGAVAKGITMVVAAGNSNFDACQASPAREPSAITVGATTSIDYRASFSNWGSCLDVFAPGGGITSAWNTSATASNTISGTSMASPHVAGVAALALQQNPTASPEAISALIVSTAAVNRLPATSIGSGSPNLLLQSQAGGMTAVQPATRQVAVRSLAGSASKSGNSWRASVTASVRDVATGAAVVNATVSGSFSPGGAGSCVTGSTGSCVLGSAALKIRSVPSTTFTATGISGTLMNYDVSQNAVSQIVVGQP